MGGTICSQLGGFPQVWARGRGARQGRRRAGAFAAAAEGLRGERTRAEAKHAAAVAALKADAAQTARPAGLAAALRRADLELGRRRPYWHCTASVAALAKAVPRVAEAADTAEEETRACVVRMDAPRAAVFVPCAHLVALRGLRAAAGAVPRVCRATVTTRISPIG